MNDIWTTRDLRDRGYSSAEIARRLRNGELVKIRTGAYELPVAEERRLKARHRTLILATAPQLGAETVVSHGSAAVLHQLPIWPTAVRQVHVTKNRSNGARQRAWVFVHGATLPVSDVTVVDGVAVTSLARTVVDLARTLPWEQAVAAGDHALTLGLDRSELAQCLDRMLRWRGTAQARRVAGFLDPLSESPGESVSRVRCFEQGIPAPRLQYVICDRAGRRVARCDFGWEEFRTVGEFDGKVKYGELVRPGQRIEDVVLAEKRREQAIRDEGWQVVRWLWDDLYRPGVIGNRLRRAFELAA
jgi:predicted transcriptional regulator of viral defense system